jgi:hypothetical protein
VSDAHSEFNRVFWGGVLTIGGARDWDERDGLTRATRRYGELGPL